MILFIQCVITKLKIMMTMSQDQSMNYCTIIFELATIIYFDMCMTRSHQLALSMIMLHLNNYNYYIQLSNKNLYNKFNHYMDFKSLKMFAFWPQQSLNLKAVCKMAQYFWYTIKYGRWYDNKPSSHMNKAIYIMLSWSHIFIVTNDKQECMVTREPLRPRYTFCKIQC